MRVKSVITLIGQVQLPSMTNDKQTPSELMQGKVSCIFAFRVCLLVCNNEHQACKLELVEYGDVKLK